MTHGTVYAGPEPHSAIGHTRRKQQRWWCARAYVCVCVCVCVCVRVCVCVGKLMSEHGGCIANASKKANQLLRNANDAHIFVTCVRACECECECACACVRLSLSLSLSLSRARSLSVCAQMRARVSVCNWPGLNISMKPEILSRPGSIACHASMR